MSRPPVSWLVVEAGWKVLASDGSELGRVDELVGDTGKDIFNGLTVSTGLLKGSRYVPAERVEAIFEGEVLLAMGRREFDRLDEYGDAPPSAEIRPG
jgi:hypothetical protein